MITTTIRIDGLIDLADEIDAKAKPVLRIAMKQASARYLAEVRRRLFHRAAKDVHAEPGASPLMHTGELANAFEEAPVTVKGRFVSGGIEANNIEPAKVNALEYGAVRNGKNIPAHPFVRPAGMLIEKEIDAILQEAISAMG